MKLKAVTKITAPRALAAALLLAVGAAGSSIAIAQQQSAAGVVVDGETYTAANIPTDFYSLAFLLAKAQTKAQLVALLNIAAQAGADKPGLSGALFYAIAFAEDGSPIEAALKVAKKAVDASSVSSTGQLTFYEGSNPNATGAVSPSSGNNAASGSPIQTSNNSGGLGTATSSSTTTTTVVYVG